ncbi:unnamed protein product [Closterium sp. NIES-53]
MGNGQVEGQGQICQSTIFLVGYSGALLIGFSTSRGPPVVSLVPARSALAQSGPTRTVSRCPAATRTACPPARRAQLQPSRRTLLPCASRPAAASASSPTAASASRSAALASCPAALHNARLAALRPAATTAVAAARATATAGGGAAGSAGSAGGAGGAGGATGSAGGAAGAAGATRSAGGAARAGGLHLPTFSTNLMSNAAIHDVWVDTFIPGGQRVAIYTCFRTGRHLATLTRRPRSSLYTLTTVSGQLASSCSCRVLSHQTLLWHHRLSHLSLWRLRGMHSRLLVSGLPRSLPSLLCSPAPPCLPCVEGRQPAAPHSSEFPPTTAPLQTLHMDVWGPCPVGGTDQERYFLLVVDDYTRYTTVFPLRRKADVGIFSSDLLAENYQDEGIVHSFTLPPYPLLNGIAECRIGLIIEVAQTSPTLQWTGKFGDASVFLVWGTLSLVRDANASKLSSRTLRCVFLGFPTNAPPWQFYYPHERQVFSSQDVTFDEFVCYYRLHPHTSHPVPLAPCFLVPVPPPVDPLPPQGPAPSGAEIAGAEPRGAETEVEGSGGAAIGGAVTGGAISVGVAIGGAGSWGAATRGVDSGGPASPSGGGAVGDPAGGPGAGQPPQPDLLETLLPQAIRVWIVRRGSPGGGGYGPAGAGAASPGGIASAGGTAGGVGGAAGAGGTRGAAGARGAGATSHTGATGAGGARPTSPGGNGGAGGAASARGAGGTGGAAAAAAGAGGAADAGGAGGATRATGTGGAGGTTGARGPSAAGASGAAGAGGAGGAAGATGAEGAGAAGAGGAGAADQSQPQLLPGSPLLALGPHTEVTESLTERCEPETRASTSVRARRVACPRPPAVPGTHGIALRPSFVPQRVVLPEPPVSSLPHVPDPQSDLARAACYSHTRLECA